MTTTQIFIFILTTIIFHACCGQERTNNKAELASVHINLDSLPELKKIVDGLEKGNCVESSQIGESGTRSKQWDKYEQLKVIATNDQLVALTNHKNSAVRCYAFQALVTRRSDKILSILLNHLSDTSKVSTLSGCIGMTQYTGDYFVDVITPNRVEIEVDILNSTEKKILDSVLINDNSIVLSAKSFLLESLLPTPNYYSRIRQLVTIDGNESALRALARYQKQTDKEIIAIFFNNNKTEYSALYAVREFPDEYFYHHVKNVFEQEMREDGFDYQKLRICYQALAKYPKAETVELFDRITKIKDEFKYNTHCKYFLLAITKYPNKLYDPIKAKLKLSRFILEDVEYELENGN